ncbi:MAG TPA: GNAT family N-acetyltransferase, partial [Pirellulaceae bacterium]|nr:GNAT family N-acetyltransferase [Pirellulaceae bacterium]
VWSGADLPMQVRRIAGFDAPELGCEAWNTLARGVPFRRWEWLRAWWDVYGLAPTTVVPACPRALFLLGAFDTTGRLRGLAPLLAETSVWSGRTLMLLGSGDVCSDYLTLLTARGDEDEVARAMADWLASAHDEPEQRWDQLLWSGVAVSDRVIPGLSNQLAELGHRVWRRPSPSCWRIVLPDTWSDYLARLSRSHASQIRRLERRWFETGRAVLRTAETTEQRDEFFATLVDLHQRRRLQLGQPGCFADSRFDAFVRRAIEALWPSRAVRLCQLDVDGEPVAAELLLVGHDVLYAYQSGIAPERLESQPGRLLHVALLRQAIAERRRAFDFLRGDEPYKAHWRAEPLTQLELRVASRRGAAPLRQDLLRAATNVKAAMKGILPRS